MKKILCIVWAITLFIAPTIKTNPTQNGPIRSMDELYNAMVQDCKQHKLTAQYFTTFEPSEIKCDAISDLLMEQQDKLGISLCRVDWYWQRTLSGCFYDVKYIYHTSKEEMEVAEKIAQKIAKEIKNYSTYEKIKITHDYLILLGEYTEDGACPYAALYEKKPNCVGYTMAFMMIMEACNVGVKYQTSDTHAWNLVLLDDKWYNIDVCWDDTGAYGGNVPPIIYDHFLKGQEDWVGHINNQSTATKGYEGDLTFGTEIVEKLLKKDFTKN